MATGATSAEALAGAVTVNAELGSSVAVTFTDSASHSVIKMLTGSGSAQNVMLDSSDIGSGASQLQDGSITVSANATDAAGNTSMAGNSSFTLDTAKPDTPVFALGAGVSDGATFAEAQAGAVTVNAELGSSVAVTFTDSNSHSVIKMLTGSGSAQNVMLDSSDIGSGANQLQDGSITVSANATDAAGNTSMAGNSSFTLDTAKPVAPVFALGAGVSDGATSAEALAGAVTVNAELGSSVAVTFSDSNSHSVIKLLTGTGSALTVTLDSSDIGSGANQLQDGSITVSANATDAAGNSSMAGNSSFTLDTAKPDAPVFALVAGVATGATSAEAQAGAVTVNAELGSSVAVTFTDSNSHSVIKMLTGSGSAQNVMLDSSDIGSGANQLQDGSITVSANTTDAAGNTSMAGNSSFTLDTAKPVAPIFALVAGVATGATSAEALAGAVTVNAELGSSVAVTFSDSASHSVIKMLIGSGSAPNVMLDSSDIGSGASQLQDGSITVSANATDAAGNTSMAGSSSFTLDTAKPDAPVFALVAGVATGATSAEALAGAVTVNAELGSSVAVTFTDSNSHSVIKMLNGTGSALTVTLDSSDIGSGSTQLLDGSITVSANATDAAGNTSMAGNSSFTLDTAKPVAPVFALVAGVATGATSAEALAGAVTVNAELGSSVAVTFSDSNSHSVIKLLTGTGSALTVTLDSSDIGSGASQLQDGSITVSANATDAAGNTSMAGNSSFTLDTAKPVAPVFALGAGVSDGATSAEALAGAVTVNAELGSSVAVTFSDSNSHSVIKLLTGTGSALTVTLDSSDIGSGANQLQDGSITVSANATDAAGNSSMAGNSSFTLDTAKPDAPVFALVAGVATGATSAEAQAGAVTVNAELGSSVAVTFSDSASHSVIKMLIGSGSAQNVMLDSSDIGSGASQLLDGSITVSANATDAAGNTSMAGSSFTLDTAKPDAPVFALSAGVTSGATSAEAQAGAVTVNAELGSSVAVTFTDSNSHSVIKLLTGTGSALTVTLDSSDIGSGASQLQDGSITVSANATDAAGNTSMAGNSSFTLDTAKPVAPVFALVAGVATGATSAEALAGAVTVNAELGSSVAVTFTDSNSHSVIKMLIGSGSAQNVMLDSSDIGSGSTQLQDGSITVSANATDAAGNTSMAGNSSFTLDTAKPVAPVFALVAGVATGATSAEAEAGAVTVNAELGSSVAVTFTDSNSHSVIKMLTGSGSAWSAHQDAPAAARHCRMAASLDSSDIGSGASQLQDGSITVSANATDAAGNTSMAGSSSFTLDTAKPVAPVFALVAGVATGATSAEALAGAVTVNAELGSSVAVTFTDSNSHSVIKMLTGSGSAQNVMLDSSDIGSGSTQLLDGVITVSANATDAAGNTSTAGSSSFTLDTAKPVAPIFALVAGVATGATSAEALAGAVTVNAELGSSVAVTFTDSASHSVIKMLTGSGSAQNVMLDSSDIGSGANQLQDGSITVSANATDAAGNTSMAGSSSFTLDTAKPVAPIFALVAGVATGATSAEALAGAVTVNAELGSSVAVTFTDSNSHSVIKMLTGSGSAQNVMLDSSDIGSGSTQLLDGVITVSANATDAAGNTSMAGSSSFTLDTAKPVAPVFALVAGVAAGATSAEAEAGAVTVNAELGSSVAVTFTDSNSHSVIKMLTGSGSAQNVMLDSSDIGSGANQLQDGSITVSANATDAAGNTSTAGSSSFTLDTAKPVAPIFALVAGVATGATSAEALAGAVTVNAELGSSVAVTFTDSNSHSVIKMLTGSGSAQNVMLDSSDIGSGASQLQDGSITVSANATDAAGNTSTAGNSSFTLDTAKPDAPVFALGAGVSDGATSAEATAGSGVVTVNAELGSSVAVTFTDSNSHSVIKMLTGSGSALAVTLDSSDIGSGASQLQDGSITVSANATDAAGNTSTAGNSSFTLDTAKPDAPVFALVAGVATDATSAEAQAGAVTVNAELGSSVAVTFTDSASHSVIKQLTGTGSALAVTLDSSDLGSESTQLHDGTITISATATDAAGNTSNASTGSSSFTLDTHAPAAPVFAQGAGVSYGATAAEATATTGVVVVLAESGSSVAVTFSDSASHSVIKRLIGSSSALAVTLDSSDIGSGASQLQDGSITVSANAIDAAGNTSTAGMVSFTLDTRAPTLTIRSDKLALKSGETATITFSFSEVPIGFNAADIVTTGGTLGILSGGGATRTATFTPAADSNAGSASISVAAGGYTDAAGNDGGAGSVPTIRFDTSVPSAPVLVLAAGVSDGATAAEATARSGVLSVHAENGSRVGVRFIDSASHTVIKTLTGTGSALAVMLNSSDLGSDVGSLQDGGITVIATATDAAGNTSMAGSSSFRLDSSAPSAPALALDAGVYGGATAAEATAESGVISVTAESGSRVLVTFSDSAAPAHSLVKTIIGSGSAQSVVLGSSDIGSGVSRLLDGAITVIASATDAAGNTSTAGNSSFTLDTLAPDAPSFSTNARITAEAVAGRLYLDADLNILDYEDAVSIGRNSDGSYSFYFYPQQEAVAGLDHISIQAVKDYVDLYAEGTFNAAYALQLENLAIPGRQLQASVYAEFGSTTVITFTDSLLYSVSKTVLGAGFDAGQAVQVSLLPGDWGSNANQLVDGNIEVSVLSTDRAGNTSMAGSSFTLDTQAPDVPIFSTNAWITFEPAAGRLYLDADLNILDYEDAVSIGRNSDGSYSFYFYGQEEAVAGLDHISIQAVKDYVDLYAEGSFNAAYALQLENLAIPGRQLLAGVYAEFGSTTVISFTDNLLHSVSKTVIGAGQYEGQAVYVSLLPGDWGSDANQLLDGIIEVSVLSTDSAGNTSMTGSSFTLDTQPPVIRSHSLSVNENTQAVGSLAVSNGDSVSWALEGNGDDNNLFAIDPATGALSWVADSGGDFEATEKSAAGSNTYTLTVSATDAAGNQSTQVIQVDLLDVNEAPVNVFPATALVVNEDTRLALDGISVSDADVGANGIASVYLGVAHGTLRVTANAANGGVAAGAISGNGGGSITLLGTAAAINATLATLDYQGHANFNGSDTLTLLSSDGGTPVQSSSSATSITVTPVNDAPTLSGIPAGMAEISANVASALGNLTVSDVDGANTPLFVTLTPGNGSIGGFTAGNNGNGLTTTIASGTVRLRGTAAVINTALAALTFTASAAETASLAVRVSDVDLNDSNPGTSNSSSFRFSVTGTPVLRISSGQDAYINNAEIGVDVEVSFSNLASSDTVQLRLDGALLGNPYTVSASEASERKISLSIAKSDLGADGSKSISVDVVHGDTPTASNTLAVTLDTTVPGTPTLALGAGLTGVVSAAAATASSGVITIHAEVASRVLVTFTDSSNHAVTKTLTGTGSALAVVLGSSDIGVGNNQLQEGVISISAVASDAAGNVSPVGSSSFTLDTTPLGITSTAFGVQENVQLVGYLVARPVEAGTYFALEGNAADNSLFSLLANQGVLQWVSASGRDFEGAAKSAAGSNIYTISVTASDASGNKSSPQTITITLQDANDAPANSVPAAQIVSEDTDLAFSGSSLISVSDQDAGSQGIAWVRLSVLHGTLWVRAAVDGGLAANSISNNGTDMLTLSGSTAAINSTLATLIYRPSANCSGADTLTVLTSDGGSPALTASNSVAISVTTVNDAPTLSGIPADVANVTIGVAAELDNFSVADVDSSTLYVRLIPSNGSISGLGAGRDAMTDLITAIDSNTGSICLTGSAAAINTRLGLIRFSATAAGAASIVVDVSDVELEDSTSHASGSYLFSAHSLPVPVLGIASGQDAILNSADSSLTVLLSLAGLASGDSVQPKLNGGNLGSAYSVTAADISAGQVSLPIAKSSLGADTALGSSKAISAVVTHNGTASPESKALKLTLDTSLPSVQLSLGNSVGNGVANGATLAEAIAESGVVSVTAESGSLVALSFTDVDNTRITRLLTGTGNAQVITLAASEIGVNSNQLHDGTITVNVVALDGAGNVNTAVSSFVLDTVAPTAPKLLPTHWSLGWIAVATDKAANAESVFMSQSGMTAATGFAQFSTEPGVSVQVSYFANYFSPTQTAALVKSDSYSGDGATLQALRLSSAELMALNTSQLELVVSVTDAAGNSSPAARLTYRLNPSPLLAPVLALGAGISNSTGATLAKAAAGAIRETVAANLLVSSTFVDAFGHSVSSVMQSSGGASSVGLAATSIGTGTGQLQDGTITATVLAVDAYGNLAPASSISFVLDSTAPRLAAATLATNRNSINLTFTEAIDGSALSLAAANSLLVFKTSSSGNSPISNPYSGISVNGNSVTLTLSAAVSAALTSSPSATIQYNAPAGEQTSAVVQDTAGNDMAMLAATSLSAVPVATGFAVSDSGSSNGSNRGKAGEAVSVLVNFSEAVSLSANATYSVRVQIGSSSANGFDATLVTSASAPTASSNYTFRGNLPASTGLASNALTLTALTIPSGKSITGSSGVLSQTSYSTLSSNSYIVDSSAPTLSIDTIQARDAVGTSLNMVAGVSTTIVFNFSENPGSSFVWDGNIGDIAVTGGTLSALWGAGQKRYATFVPTSNSNNAVASISVAAGSYSDAAGNAGAGSSSSFSFDTLPPLTPIIKLGNGVLGAATTAEALQASGVVTVEAELGQAVTVRFAAPAISPIDKTVVGQGQGIAVPVTLNQADLDQLGPNALNTLTVSATASDAAGNQSQSTASFVYDKEPPAAVGFSYRDTGLFSNDRITNDSFITVDSPNDAIAFYTSDAGDTWTRVSGSGFYLATNTSYAANTIGVKTVDAAGNSSAAAASWIATGLIIDNRAPDAPGITLQDGLGNSASAASVRITAESGSTVLVTFSDGTRSKTAIVNGQGSATPVEARLAASDFGSGAAQLHDGSISVTAVATDLAGNAGAATSSQFARNSSLPALFIQSGQDAFVNHAESGVDLYVYSNALAINDTLQLQLGASNLGSAYTLLASDVTAGRVALRIAKSDLVGGEGQKSIRVNFTHSGTTTSSTPLTLTLDTGVPAAPLLQLHDSLQNGASLTEALSNTGVVFVSAESAARVTLTFSDSASRTITKQVSGQGSHIPVAVALAADDIGSRADQLHDGSISVRAVATDAAGNASAVGSSSFVLYATAPAAPQLTLAAGVEGGTTLAEASAASGVLRVSGPSGSIAWLSFSDGVYTFNHSQLLSGGSDAVVLAASAIGSGATQLHDGTISVSGVLTDGAGNLGPVANARFVLDTANPLAPTLQLGSGVANGASLGEALARTGVLLVRAESAASVVLTFGDSASPAHSVVKTVIGQGSNTLVPVTLLNAELGSLANQLQDGNIQVSAIATDTAGNVSALGSSSFLLDTVANAPTLQLGSGVSDGATLVEATASTGVLSVLAESGGTVLVTFRDSASHTVVKTVPGIGARQPVTLAESDMGVASKQLQDGSISVSAVVTDAAGNTSPAASSSFNLAADVLPLVLTLGTGVANGATLAETTASSGVLLVQGDAGNAISLTFSDSSSPAHTVVRRLTATGTEQAVTLAANELGSGAGQLTEGLIRVSASSSNGRRARGDASAQFVLDTLVPAALTGSVSLSFSADTGTPGDFITSTHAQTITVHLNDSLAATDVLWGSLDGGTNWSNLNRFVSGNTLSWTGATLLVGSNTLKLQAKDQAGNAGPVLEQAYVTGDLAPSLVLGAGLADGASRAEASASSGVVTVHAAAGSSVTVRFTDTLNHTLIKTVAVDATGSSQPVLLDSSDIGTGVGQLSNGQISLRVVAALPGGPDSEEASANFTLYADILALGSGVADGAALHEVVAGSGVVTLYSVSGDKVLVTFTDSATPTPHSRVKTLTGSGVVQAVTLQASDIGTAAGGLLDGTISVTAVAYDAANSANNSGSTSFTLDTLAPNTQIVSTSIGLSADTGVAGDLITKTAAQTITATLSDPLAAGETLWASQDDGSNWANVSGSVSGTNVSMAAQTLLVGSHTLAFRVMDAAGNTGPITTQTYTLDTTPPTAFVPSNSGLKLLSANHQFAVLPEQAAAISGDLSLEAWVFADGTPGQWARIVDLSEETGFFELYSSVFLAFVGGKLTFSIYKASDFKGQVITDGNFPINSWHHVAVTLESSKLATLYLDGVAVKSAFLLDLPAARPRSRSFVGHSTLGSDPDFNGTIRDVRIYDNARTAAEISSDMAGSVDIGDANLRGYYPFSSSAASGKPDLAPATLTATPASAAPIFAMPSLRLSGDTGVQGDFSTSTQLQTITAWLNAPPAADEKVWGSLNNGSTWVDLSSYTSGNTVTWSNVILGTGQNTMKFEVRDLAGNAGTLITQEYSISPLTTQVSSISIGFSADTGNAGDLVTKTVAQTITATLGAALAAGETLRYRLDSGNNWTDVNAASISGTNVSIPAQTLLSGSHNLEFQVSNVAGTVGPITSRPYTLDTTPPTAFVSPATGLKLLSASRQFAQLPSAAVAVSGDLTLEAWVFADGTPGQKARIFDFNDGVGLSNNMILSFDGGKLAFASYNHGGAERAITVDSNFPINSWHHVAVTTTGDHADIATLYIDGAAVKTGFIVDSTPSLTRTNAFVGHSNVSADPDFNGTIRDVRIYDNARTAAEIISDMAGTVNAADANLKGYYPFSSSAASGKTGGVAATLTGSPVITIPALTLSNDTGTQGDYTTSTRAQTITAKLNGILAADEKVWGTLNGELATPTWIDLSSFTSGNVVTWTGATLGTTGLHTMKFEVRDLAGNTGTLMMQDYRVV